MFVPETATWPVCWHSVGPMTQNDPLGQLSSGPYWQLVQPQLGEGEMPVHYAQLRRVTGTEEVSGALFLTTEQILWRTVDPRKPEGSGHEVGLGDILELDRPSRFSAFQAFRVVTEHDGRPADTYFFPGQRTGTDKLLCAHMYEVAEAAWQRHRALRRTA